MPCDNPDHRHIWPTQGLLTIWSCERRCMFCTGPHSNKEYKCASNLRKHVQRVHFKKYRKLQLFMPKGRQLKYEDFPTDDSDNDDEAMGEADTSQSAGGPISLHKLANAAANRGKLRVGIGGVRSWTVDTGDAISAAKKLFRGFLEFCKVVGFHPSEIYQLINDEMDEFFVHNQPEGEEVDEAEEGEEDEDEDGEEEEEEEEEEEVIDESDDEEMAEGEPEA